MTNNTLARAEVCQLLTIEFDSRAVRDARYDWDSRGERVKSKHNCVPALDERLDRALPTLLQNLRTAILLEPEKTWSSAELIVAIDALAWRSEMSADRPTELPHSQTPPGRVCSELNDQPPVTLCAPQEVSVGTEWDVLSPAESEIAILAAAGWPNSAIAARRGSSIRTVDAQVAAVLRKLSLASRRDIILHVPRLFLSIVDFEARRRPRRPAGSRR
ncbi:helix-turn-helix domain-containing protein [Nocardia sp. CY41]|uniref:helix-turn-helix domain-containing protein n=1 Tax=Nocardia sp. CY41 TaxID=2608686 RepID=UPI003FA5D674